jgi:hypothetical protein
MAERPAEIAKPSILSRRPTANGRAVQRKETAPRSCKVRGAAGPQGLRASGLQGFRAQADPWDDSGWARRPPPNGRLFFFFGKAPHGNGEADKVHDAQETVHLVARAQSFDLHAKLERAQTQTPRWTVEAGAPSAEFRQEKLEIKLSPGLCQSTSVSVSVNLTDQASLSMAQSTTPVPPPIAQPLEAPRGVVQSR